MSHNSLTKQNLLREIENALDAVDGYGSVDIIVQDGKVTQISIRNIKKTSLNIAEKQEIPEVRKPKLFTIQARMGRLRE
ncbi:MAG: hypothetical protein A3C30_04470 [Candidatus Levybacteria bacterium RIFCSPHIGHO2_02_FULL_40_18]|nr:MAG: hypothetical protein A2869_01560 [Candidatus Levybacteria bacterium RIFCSPHIGHO2_01_FULL_40_58]OGH26335.1 MAG: hypothetical protein A3C30_04470 [Candidatus Levybacteria bacterium RIFCSPHIGHO2_02_FULL_40_18]OGH31294.1 MAG: hypothetical protein A3E43_02725 [Candidatus Levybacteria bacterium RIFCSPHIGHO2_12_FULL_40_31]OGH40796.1 MAG: hypothetical protein A2894_02160 [Candidatus Levybacteria bacterium RIFCSPLOWO2_01_FULL_40_64]OGH49210.1 MAG: hypothetical protein A3I54_01005 [Candidatus Lev